MFESPETVLQTVRFTLLNAIERLKNKFTFKELSRNETNIIVKFRVKVLKKDQMSIEIVDKKDRIYEGRLYVSLSIILPFKEDNFIQSLGRKTSL